MTETQTKVEKLVGMNYRARVAWDGRGWQGQVDLFSFIAIDFFPRWTCTHSHTTRDEAIACAVRYCKENPAD